MSPSGWLGSEPWGHPRGAPLNKCGGQEGARAGATRRPHPADSDLLLPNSSSRVPVPSSPPTTLVASAVQPCLTGKGELGENEPPNTSGEPKIHARLHSAEAPLSPSNAPHTTPTRELQACVRWCPASVAVTPSQNPHLCSAPRWGRPGPGARRVPEPRAEGCTPFSWMQVSLLLCRPHPCISPL